MIQRLKLVYLICEMFLLLRDSVNGKIVITVKWLHKVGI